MTPEEIKARDERNDKRIVIHNEVKVMLDGVELPSRAGVY